MQEELKIIQEEKGTANSMLSPKSVSLDGISWQLFIYINFVENGKVQTSPNTPFR